MSKKPDIIVTLAVLIGLGVLITELTTSSMAAQERPTQVQSRY